MSLDVKRKDGPVGVQSQNQTVRVSVVRNVKDQCRNRLSRRAREGGIRLLEFSEMSENHKTSLSGSRQEAKINAKA
jgi:hypothetical protein